ncbi:MAG: alpha/beta fold hydrolase BchO [Gemmatimonadota bacterium]
MNSPASPPPSWELLRGRWPNADASRFVRAADLQWHVQVLGTGPVALLLHGSWSASHSWRDIAPLLARHFTVIVPDLPGHGFTSRPTSAHMSLAGIASALDALLRALPESQSSTPAVIAGHSAGGAIALQMATVDARAPRSVVGINAALVAPGAIVSALAPAIRMLTRTGLIGALASRVADSDWMLSALMRSTGSTISPQQYELYRAFARSREHSDAVMEMFAGWDVTALNRALPSIEAPVTLVVGAKDGWVPAADAERVARLLPHATVVTLPNAGHIAHEEFPVRVAEIIAGSVP